MGALHEVYRNAPDPVGRHKVGITADGDAR
jgi:hypothetical protein